MTDFRGVNNTLRNNVPKEKIGVGEAYGVMRVAYDEYSFAAVIDTTDTLYMQEIPVNARVYDAVLKHADLGTTGLFNIGWQAGANGDESADADGFFAAVDVNSAADVQSARNDAAAPAGIHKSFSEAVQVVIVPTEVTTATSGDISLAIYFAVD